VVFWIADVRDSGDGICVSLEGSRGARSNRTFGCCFSCCTREVAIAGTVKPAKVPLHASANSARHPIFASVPTAIA
jgi:hypothetical protein